MNVNSAHAAGHGVVGCNHALAGQIDECGQAAAAGDYRATVAAVDHAYDEILQQTVGGDRGLELGESGLAGRCLADVGRRQLQLAERDGFVNGGGNMYRRGGAKMYHGLGGSLSA